MEVVVQESDVAFWHCAWKTARFGCEHMSSVLASVKAKLPAMVAALLEGRAVNWNPQACCEAAGAATATVKRCFTPGKEVGPLGNATLTLLLLFLSLAVPVWQPPEIHDAPSPGPPQWPGSGPYS